MMILMHSVFSRTTSFLLAMALSGLILMLPQALTNQDGTVDHSLLMLLMFGIMIGFIHGIGFKVKSVLMRYIIGPLLAWPIMIAGIVIMLNRTGTLL